VTKNDGSLSAHVAGMHHDYVREAVSPMRAARVCAAHTAMRGCAAGDAVHPW
jgi:hypothetical protein